MARIKYATDIDPLLNEHFGYIFQPNHYGQSMFPASRSSRFRRPRQHNRQQNNQKAVTQWRNMTPETKAAWNLFASTYVQSTKRGVGTYLTGYQLFIKRNSYCFLNHGITSEFMLEPAMEALKAGTTIFTIEAGDNTIDLTELYISNFGILPNVGQTLLFCAIPYSDVSGQFFAPVFEVLSVIDVYVDGFFLNLSIPPQSNNILYSVYLSKPVSAGMSYVGTKVRYMGCFTTKKFTALSDVPAVTPADAGKVWGVNPDGTWSAIPGGGGGGLTCEDLPACPTIIAIEADLLSIRDLIQELHYISVPQIRFGILYNNYVIRSASNISSSDLWVVPTYEHFQTFIASFGETQTSAWPYPGWTNNFGIMTQLSDSSLDYWTTVGLLNTLKYNARGSGIRATSFSSIRVYFGIHSSTPGRLANRSCHFYFSSTTSPVGFSTNNLYYYGYAIRLCKPSTLLLEGQHGTYYGNNGRTYRTVVIAGIEWLADNLAETIFRDGSAIPEITDQATWNAATTPALCAYNNDWTKV